jgi:uncharacterized protein YlxW (UPF0749 family)
MKLSKILIIVSISLLLISNGFLVYQSIHQNRTINDLQTKTVNLETEVNTANKAIKAVNVNVNNTDTDVQNVCQALTQC